MQYIMLKSTNFNVGVMLWKIHILISTCTIVITNFFNHKCHKPKVVSTMFLPKNAFINQNKRSAWHVMLISLFISSCS